MEVQFQKPKEWRWLSDYNWRKKSSKIINSISLLLTLQFCNIGIFYNLEAWVMENPPISSGSFFSSYKNNPDTKLKGSFLHVALCFPIEEQCKYFGLVMFGIVVYYHLLCTMYICLQFLSFCFPFNMLLLCKKRTCFDCSKICTYLVYYSVCWNMCAIDKLEHFIAILISFCFFLAFQLFPIDFLLSFAHRGRLH